jgi:protein-tyrosine phosphatase
MIDFHNHLIPGVDDGAASVAEAREGLAAFAADGVETVVATPHFDASLTLRPERARNLDRLDRGLAELRALAGSEFPRVRIERGVELLLDHPSPDLSDDRLRLAGTSFVLVEFPFMSIPPHSALAIGSIRSSGWKPIIAHPERYSNLGSTLQMVESWRDAGALIQVNAGSLVGRYGKRARATVWQILYHGLADYLCSDYHSRGPTLLRPAREAMAAESAKAQWQILTQTNPARMLAGDEPLAVDPVEEVQQSLWERLTFRSRTSARADDK